MGKKNVSKKVLMAATLIASMMAGATSANADDGIVLIDSAITLEANKQITNTINLGSNRYSAVYVQGESSLATGDYTLIANASGAAGRNVVIENSAANTNFSFTGNLIGSAISTGTADARALRSGGSNSETIYDGNISIYTQAVGKDSLGIQAWNGSKTTFTGNSTEVSSFGANNTGGYTRAIQVYDASGASVTLSADLTTLEAEGGQYAHGIYAHRGKVYVNGDTDITAKNAGASMGTAGINVLSDKTTTDATYNAGVYLNGDNINITSDSSDNGAVGLLSSGYYSTIESSSDNLHVTAKSDSYFAYGVNSQYSGNVNLLSGSNTIVDVEGKYAYGTKVGKYGGSSGNFTSNGNLTINATGEEFASGVHVADNGSYTADQLTVNAEATGTDATAYGAFISDSANIVLGSEGKESSLIASADNGESYGLWIQKTGTSPASAILKGTMNIEGSSAGIVNLGGELTSDADLTVANGIYNAGTLNLYGKTDIDLGIGGDTGIITLGADSVTSVLGEEVVGSSSIVADTINVTSGAKISFDFGDSITANTINGTVLGIDSVYVDRSIAIDEDSKFNLFTDAYIDLDANSLAGAYSAYKGGYQYTLVQDSTDKRIVKMAKGSERDLTKAVDDTTEAIQTVDYELTTGGESYGSATATDEERTISKNTDFLIKGTDANTDIVKAADANTKGIIVSEDSILTIEKAQFDDFKADSNGALENHGTLNLNEAIMGANNTVAVLNAEGATLNIKDSVIRSTIINRGTLISDPTTYTAQQRHLGTSAEATYSGDTFNGATASTTYPNGGAIYNEGTLTIQKEVEGATTYNPTFTGNTSSGRGGAIYTSNTTTISDAIFGSTTDANLGNNADEGGAIFIDTGNKNINVAINNTVFANNSATTYGGAIDHRMGTVNITGSTFSNNSAGEQGGAILERLQTANAFMTISDSTFTSNTAKSDGGAVDAFANLTIQNTNFTSNSVTGTSADGGGALFLGSEAVASVTGNGTDKGIFSNNTSSTRGGAIATRDTAQGNNVNGKLDITNVQFTGNQATTDGGAIYNAFYNDAAGDGYVKVTGSTFTNNSAARGGAVFNDGADRGGNVGVISFTDTNFTGNTATDNGGAIYNKGLINIIANSTNVSFSGNTADSNPNDIYNENIVSLNAGSGKKITIGGGIDGSNGTVNINNDESSTGEVIFNGDVSGNNVAVAKGTLTNNAKIDGALTVNGGQVANSAENSEVTGNLTVTGGKITSNASKIATDASSTIAVGGGEVELTGGSLTHNIAGIDDGTGTVSGGTVTIKTTSTSNVTIAKAIADQTIDINSGTMKLDVTNGGDISDSTVKGSGILSLVDNAYDHDVNLGIVDTTANALRVDLDVDFANQDADSITAASIVGDNGIDINHISINSDPTQTEFVVHVAHSDIADKVNFTDVQIDDKAHDGSTITGGLLLSYDNTSGDISGNHTNLENAIRSAIDSKAYTVGDGDLTSASDLKLGGTSLSVTADGKTITGADQSITLAKNTQTLTIKGGDNGATISGFSGTAIDNTKGGTVKLDNVTMTGNGTDIINNGGGTKGVVLTGETSIDSITNATDSKGRTTIGNEDGNADNVTVGSIKQGSVYIKNDGVLSIDADKLVTETTTGTNNSGVLNLAGGDDESDVRTTASAIIGDGTTNIEGHVETGIGKNIAQDALNIEDDAVLSIADGSSITVGETTVKSGGKLNNSGLIHRNSGTTNNKIIVEDGAELTNTGDNAKIGADIDNSGTVNNTAEINQNSTVTNKAGGVINNTGDGVIKGAITNAAADPTDPTSEDGVINTTASGFEGGVDNDGILNLNDGENHDQNSLNSDVTGDGTTNINGSVQTDGSDIEQGSVVVGNDGTSPTTGSDLAVNGGSQLTTSGDVDVADGNALVIRGNDGQGNASKADIGGDLNVGNNSVLAIVDDAELEVDGDATVDGGELILAAINENLTLSQDIDGGDNGVNVSVYGDNDKVANVESAITNATNPVNVKSGATLALNDGGTITDENDKGQTINLEADSTGANGANLEINTQGSRTFDNDVTATAGAGSSVDINGDGYNPVTIKSTMHGVDDVNINNANVTVNADGKTSTSDTFDVAQINLSDESLTDDYSDIRFSTDADNYTVDNDILSDNNENWVSLDGNSGTAGTASDPGTVFNIADGTTIKDATVVVENGQLNLPNENVLSDNGSSVIVNEDSTLNAMNGGTSEFNSVTLDDGSQVKADINALSGAGDKFNNAQQSSDDGVTLTDIGLQDLSKIVHHTTQIDLSKATNLNNLTIGDELLNKTFTEMTPIRKMTASVSSDGMLTILPSSGRNDYSSFNPSIVASSVAAQLGGYLTQLNSYDEAFRNMDMYMLMTKRQRQALKLRNKYAAAGQTNFVTYDPNQTAMDHAGAWFRPYATFEKVNLKHGPKVSNIAYGSFFGGESEMKDLGHGWDGMWGAYIGYNGSHQTYNNVGIYQNGGTLGLVGMAYKGNFFTGLTVNAGANAAEANTFYGHENFAMLMAGVASKTGYNWELAKGSFIIQPSFLASYSFVNTFDYTNAAGVRINTKPLHGIQIEPGLKFIGNLKNGWQPYIGVSFVWNIIDKTDFHANDIALPELSVRPFVKYGIGVRKTWGERLTGFFQTYFTNGGRTGVGLQTGFRWSIGKNLSTSSKPSSTSKSSRTVIKKSKANASSPKVANGRVTVKEMAK